MHSNAIVDPAMTNVAEVRSLKESRPRRTIGFVTASSIVIANIIGTGIFTSLGFQVAEIQSGFALLMLWIVGGIAALCGALCYGELSAALPRSGGEYHFLSQIYHPALGFMAGFVSATVGFAAPTALAAMAFGKYFGGVFDLGSPVVLSFLVVWVVTVFHLWNLQVGSAFQNLSTLVKLLLIGVLIAAGFFFQSKQPISFLPVSGDTSSIFSGAFAVALVYVMYSHWRSEEAGKECSPITLGRDEHRDRNLRAAQCHLPRHNADCRTEEPTRSGVDRRQTYFRPDWWPHRWRSDLPGPDFLNQLNDVDRAEGQHVDGRGSLAASFAWPQES